MQVPHQVPHRILVAGATGAVGRRLTPALAAAGHDVHALVRSEGSANAARRLGAAPVRGDALVREDVRDAVAAVRPDVVVHLLTALPADPTDRHALAAGLAMTNRLRREATAHLVAAAEATGVGRVIAASIAFAYRPVGPWVVTEDHPLDTTADGPWGEVVGAVAELERLVRADRAFTGVVLRLGGFYGPGTPFAPDGALVRLVRRRRLPVVGDGRGRQSFLHVDDAATAVVAALGAPAGTWNVTDDEPLPAATWVRELAAAAGAPAPRHVPAWLARMAAGEDAVRSMTVQRGADNARFTQATGWRPVHRSFPAGLRASTAAAA